MQISSNTYFTYDGHQSYLYGLRFAWIEDSPETVMVSEKKYSTIKNNSLNYFRISKSTHADPLEFDAEMVSDRVLYDAEVRRIYEKFFDSNEYKTISLPVNDEEIFFNCILTNVEKLEGGLGDKFGVVGFKLKIICDAPWGWTQEKICYPRLEKFNDQTGEAHFIIRNWSEAHEYIYPEIEIELPAASENMYNTRIPNRYSCLGCSLLSRCRGESASFPAYMTDDDIAAYSISSDTTAAHIPDKVMLINTSDDQARGTCIFYHSSQPQTIRMSPMTGSITGTTGSDPQRVNKVEWTNKVFVRLVPGDNDFYTQNVPYEIVDGEKVSKLKMKFREARVLV